MPWAFLESLDRRRNLRGEKKGKIRNLQYIGQGFEWN